MCHNNVTLTTREESPSISTLPLLVALSAFFLLRPLAFQNLNSKEAPVALGYFYVTVSAFKFHLLLPTTMPRRSPPSALRLTTGPIPSLNQPKYKLPTVPRPTFYRPPAVARGPAPDTICVKTPARPRTAADIASPSGSPMSGNGMIMRGPWDHSGSIELPIDVEAMLTPLKRVAVSPV